MDPEGPRPPTTIVQKALELVAATSQNLNGFRKFVILFAILILASLLIEVYSGWVRTTMLRALVKQQVIEGQKPMEEKLDTISKEGTEPQRQALDKLDMLEKKVDRLPKGVEKELLNRR